MFERELPHRRREAERMPTNEASFTYRSTATGGRKRAREARYHGGMPSTSSPNRTRVLGSFCCVYVFCGGTYLAMRYGVEVLPPFDLASARSLIAGPIMLALSAIFKLKMRPSQQEFGRLAIIGVLMLGCGNTSVMWAEQYIPIGLAALLVASIPLYAALIEMALPHGEGLAVQGWIGVGIGFVGMVFLLWPKLRLGLHGDSRAIIAAVGMLVGS